MGRGEGGGDGAVVGVARDAVGVERDDLCEDVRWSGRRQSVTTHRKALTRSMSQAVAYCFTSERTVCSGHHRVGESGRALCNIA